MLDGGFLGVGCTTLGLSMRTGLEMMRWLHMLAFALVSWLGDWEIMVNYLIKYNFGQSSPLALVFFVVHGYLLRGMFHQETFCVCLRFSPTGTE